MKSVLTSLKYFPHIPRFIPSWSLSQATVALLWIGLILLFIVNINNVVRSKYLTQYAPLNILRNPANESVHKELALIYYKAGNISRAEEELSIYRDLTNRHTPGVIKTATPNVLGETAQAVITTHEWTEQENTRLLRYAYWQSVIEDKPDYRDAYMVLAFLATEMGKLDDASLWINKASQLDPNNIDIKQLSKEIAKRQN